MALLGDLQIIVVEADEAEAERYREHDPDIGIERIGPQQSGDHQSGKDHQPAHRRRADLGDEMRLRAVAADRLALALAKPQVIDDPGTEQEDEQRSGHHCPAGAEGDVAEHVQERAEHAHAGNRVGKIDQPIEHSKSPYTAASSCAVLPGKRFSSAFTIVFIFEPSDPLTMMASPARIVATACASSPAALSA